jgi:hypothetical protein
MNLENVELNVILDIRHADFPDEPISMRVVADGADEICVRDITCGALFLLNKETGIDSDFDSYTAVGVYDE